MPETLEDRVCFAQQHDRVVEIGVVALDADSRVTDEWSTLVNPGRDVGLTSLHGVSAHHLVNAPTFDEIVGDLLDMLCSRALVAHNARFDVGFLTAEFDAVGVAVPPLSAVCTMQLVGATGLVASRSLAECCRELGIDHSPHAALEDARAAATLLAKVAAKGWPITPPAAAWFPCRDSFPGWPPAHRGLTRTQAAAWRPASYLAGIAARLPAVAAVVDANPEAVLAYAELLDRVLEDRRITKAEQEALCEVALGWGLDVSHVGEINRSYLTSLVALALADGVLTDEERDDLEWVGCLFGLDGGAVAELIAAATPAARSARGLAGSAGATHEFAGKSVCFTGESQCRVDGEPITRVRAEMLAAAAGMVTARSVTKRLDILVVADPDTLSGKAKKAREYGTRIIAERVFWTGLGIAID